MKQRDSIMGTKQSVLLDKTYVLSVINQEDIFAEYTNIPVSEILRAAANKNHLLTSAFRKNDNNQSMGFMFNSKNVLKCRDFGGTFHGDCFDAVGYFINEDSSTKEGFKTILKDILARFNFLDSTNKKIIKPQTEFVTISGTEFDIVIRDWSKKDFLFYASIGIDHKKLFEHITFPILRMYVNQKIFYFHTQDDPAYAYYRGNVDGRDIWQCYWPNREKQKRYRTNGGNIAISNRIKHCKHGGIIKSKKDLMAIECAVEYVTKDPNYFQGVEVPGESTIFSHDQINYLNKFWPVQITFSDLDRAGMLFGLKHRKLYNTLPLYMTNGKFGTPEVTRRYGNVKDFCDYVQLYGIKAGYDLIEKVINELERTSYKSFPTLNWNTGIITSIVDYESDLPF